MRFLVLLFMAAGLSGCSYRDMKHSKAPAEPQTGKMNAVTYDQVRAKIEPLCLECHNSELAKAGLDLSTQAASLVAITPGDPKESLLYNMVDWDEMPPRAAFLPFGYLRPKRRTWSAIGYSAAHAKALIPLGKPHTYLTHLLALT